MYWPILAAWRSCFNPFATPLAIGVNSAARDAPRQLMPQRSSPFSRLDAKTGDPAYRISMQPFCRIDTVELLLSGVIVSLSFNHCGFNSPPLAAFFLLLLSDSGTHRTRQHMSNS
jgi:hypothetical protein